MSLHVESFVNISFYDVVKISDLVTRGLRELGLGFGNICQSIQIPSF